MLIGEKPRPRLAVAARGSLRNAPQSSEASPDSAVRFHVVPKPIHMSRQRRLIWGVLVAVITAATLLISARAVGIAEWLDTRTGVIGLLVGCAVVFAALLRIASRLGD
jgi:hypothetical protein